MCHVPGKKNWNGQRRCLLIHTPSLVLAKVRCRTENKERLHFFVYWQLLYICFLKEEAKLCHISRRSDWALCISEPCWHAKFYHSENIYFCLDIVLCNSVRKSDCALHSCYTHTQSIILYCQCRVWQSMYVMCLYQCISTCVLCVVHVCNSLSFVCMCVCMHICVSLCVFSVCVWACLLISMFIVQNNDVFYMRNGQWKSHTLRYSLLLWIRPVWLYAVNNNAALWMNLHWLKSYRV